MGVEVLLAESDSDLQMVFTLARLQQLLQGGIDPERLQAVGAGVQADLIWLQEMKGEDGR